MLKIGDLTIDVPFFQAPLSGYSDLAMRTIARQHGAPLTYNGVILDKTALSRRAFKKKALSPADDERPIGAQLLGSDPQTMASAARALQNMGYDLIDLNFACPAPKVLRRQRGGSLLNHPARAVEIFRRVRDSVSCPVTIKLRIAYDDDPVTRENFWHICRSAAQSGADALIVHGRTVLQKFRASADWSIISTLKQQLPNTPIIGSGDIHTADDIIRRLHTSGADGILVARGAIGNPWIFSHATALLLAQPSPDPPSIAQQADVITRHFDIVLGLYETRRAMLYFKKFSIHYCKHHPRRKMVQADLLAAETPQQFRDAVRKWYCTK